MTIAVTGARGFIGTAVVEALRRAGRPVRQLVRQASPEGGLDQVIVGDLMQPRELDSALRGVKAIVHCAGLAHQAPGAQTEAAIRAANADATERLARSAAAAGALRFVFLSSAKVMGERSGARPLVESDVPAPADAYARSKLEAEERLREVATETGLDITILRPPLVYGPGVRANFLRLLAACDSPWPMPLAGASAPRSLVSLGNLVDATLRCADAPLTGMHTFFVADAEAPSVAELAALLRQRLGRPQRLVAVDVSLLRGVAALLGRSAEIDRLTLPLMVDTSALRAALNWQPPQTLAQGLSETVDWWRARRAASQLPG